MRRTPLTTTPRRGPCVCPYGSHIRVETKVRLYSVYVLLVLMYGSQAWSVTKSLARRLDAFDTWSLRKILWIPYIRHVTNITARQTILAVFQFPTYPSLAYACVHVLA